jgi:hypothetical protein
MPKKASRARKGATSPTHPLKAALEAVLAGKSRFVELRDATYPVAEFERAFLERWRDDYSTKNAKYWDRLVAGMKRRGKSHQHIEQECELLLCCIHVTLPTSLRGGDLHKRVQALLRKKLNQAKEFDELAAKERAQITAFAELFKGFGDEFPSKALRGLHYRVRKVEQRAAILRGEAAEVESWLTTVPGTRQSSSRARPGPDYVARKAFIQSLSYTMRQLFGQPNDPIVAAITTLAFPEHEATERDVRHARAAPAVTPFASRQALAALEISKLQYSEKLAKELSEATNSHDFPRAERLAEKIANAEASLDANAARETLQRLYAEEFAEVFGKMTKELGVEAFAGGLVEVVGELDARTGEHLLRRLQYFHPEFLAEVENWLATIEQRSEPKTPPNSLDNK